MEEFTRKKRSRKKNSQNYINKKELLKEIVKSKENDELTKEAFEMLFLMVKRISTTLYYKNEDDREDCMQDACHDIVKYWRNFDPDYPNSNAFSYYTQIIKAGLAKGFHRLYPHNRKDIVILGLPEGFHNV